MLRMIQGGPNTRFLEYFHMVSACKYEPPPITLMCDILCVTTVWCSLPSIYNNWLGILLMPNTNMKPKTMDTNINIDGMA